MFIGRLNYDAASEQRTSKNVTRALIGTACQGGSRLLINLMAGRLGGPALLGMMQGAISTASLGSLFYSSSASATASRQLAYQRGNGNMAGMKKTAEYLTWRTLIASVFIAVVASIFTAVTSGRIDLSIIVFLLTIALSGQSFARGLHFGLGQVGRLTRWDITTNSLLIVVVACLLYSGLRSVWILVPLIVSYALLFLLSWPPRTDSDIRIEKKETNGYIILGVIGTVSSAGLLQSAVIASSLLNGIEYTGQFSAALTLVTPVSLIAGALSQSMFPAMSSDWGKQDIERIRTRLITATRIMITMIVGVLAAAGPLIAPIVDLVWGPQYSETARILKYLLWALAINAISIPAVTTLTSSAMSGMAKSAMSSVAGFIVGVTTWLLLGPTRPDIAIPVGYVAGVIVIAVVPFLMCQRLVCANQAGKHALLAFLGLIGTLGASWYCDHESFSLSIRFGTAAGLVLIWALWRRNDIRLLAALAFPRQGFRR